MDINEEVGELLSGLYSDETIDGAVNLTSIYIWEKKDSPKYIEMPPSLKEATERDFVSDPDVEYDVNYSNFFKTMGIYSDGVIKGPLNHILARMINIPRMIGGYIENYPSNEEIGIYKDPPLFQLSPDELKRLNDEYFAQAAEKLGDPEELVKIYAHLGRIGEEIAIDVENPYPAKGSTQAYELFGIFHLFPYNKTVDLTATTPGIVLPTESDPLRFKDSVPELKKNLIRPEYFEMLRRSIDLGEERSRRYSAGIEGTTKNLRTYHHLLLHAKDILQSYIDLGKRFEIRLGEQDPRMKLATLIGNMGVVFSVRDKEQKEKIAHNVTVMDHDLAARYGEIFNEQWEKGTPLDDTGILDELIKE